MDTKDEFQNIDFSKIYSPSKLKLYNQCPQQYYFSYIDPVNSKLKNKLKKLPHNIWKFQTVGKAVHNAITLFLHLPVEERTEQNLLKKLYECWFSEAQWNKKPPLGKWGGFKNLEEERESYAEAIRMLKNFFKMFHSAGKIHFLPTKDLKNSIDDYKNLITKLSESYDISGKFDLILLEEDDSLYIIDFKTSKAEDRDSFQLNFYKVLAEGRFGKLVKKASFYYLRTGKKVDFDLKTINTQELKIGILNKIDGVINAAEYDPRPSKLCRYCIFINYCPAEKEVRELIGKTKEEDFPEDLPF